MTKAEYSGQDLTEVARIERDKHTRAVAFSIDEAMSWELYAGLSVDSIDFSRPVADGKKAGRYAVDLPDSARYYFQLVTDRGNAILAERRLPMAGGYNFRDLGGIRTADGRYVKWGRVFRSDDMFALTDSDLDYLSSVPIVSVVDFRSDEEVMRAPDRLPESVEGVYAYSVSPGNLMSMITDSNGKPSPAGMSAMMEEMNRLMVTDPDVVDQYRKLFGLLSDEDCVPLLFHCSAGKDRTGMAAALILFSLGVDEQTVMADYMASNRWLGDKYSAMLDENPEYAPLMEVRAEYLQAGIDQIKETYGSVENYLTGTLGVDLAWMRGEYLY